MKKLLAVLLAATLILIPLSTLLCASAKAAESVPNIAVHGMFSSRLYMNPDDPDSELIWPINVKNSMNIISGDLSDYAQGLSSSDTDVVISTLAKLGYALFGSSMCDKDGGVTNGSGVRFSYPAKEEITPDSELYFEYDWRLDPIVLAAKLNDFIEYVCEASGCEQVTLQCHSLGSIVTEAYFKIYGHDRVKTVVFNSPALFGVSLAGDFMLGRLTLDSEALREYLSLASEGTEGTEILNTLLAVLDKLKVTDNVTEKLSRLTEKEKRELYVKSVYPLFASWLSVWAMIPDEMIDKCVDYFFNDVFAGSSDYDALREKIDYYNETVRSSKKETLIEVNEDTNLYVIAKYGYSSVLIPGSVRRLSDGVVDLRYASFGATAGQYGIPLTASQTENTPEEYSEPKNYIDSSTCLFPEQTFFIKDMFHGGKTNGLKKMIDTLLNYDGQADVNTFGQYSRFMSYSYATDRLTPSRQTSLSFIGKLQQFITKITDFFKKVFTFSGTAC